ncbi:MAG: DUF2231 domain-containing protein [Syntrophothermus sp.]
MRTKANIKGHAIHQMLIPFPIGLLMGSFFFYVVGVLIKNEYFNITSYYLITAGVIFGLFAAVFGLIDYIYSVPPESTGKQRGLKHALVNVSSIILFTAAFFLRRENPEIYNYIPMTLMLIASVLITMGGWMGGTLVNRNFIGPDHRYANKGKWKDETLSSDNGLYVAATTDELQLNQMKLLRINGKRIVLAKTEMGYAAFDDHCTHRGGSLAGGVMICNTVQCLWHGSQFDVSTGIVKSGPAEKSIAIYNTSIKDGKVYISFT